MKQRGAHETGISWSGSPCVRECFILSLWVFKALHLWNTVFNPYSLSLWSYIKLPYVVLIFLPGEITPQWVFFCCASEEFLQSGLEIQSCPHLLWAELLPQWNLCFANAKASCSLESSQYRSHLSDLSFLPPTLHIQNPRFSNDILLREEIFFPFLVLTSAVSVCLRHPHQAGTECIFDATHYHLFSVDPTFPPLPLKDHFYRQWGTQPVQPRPFASHLSFPIC